MIIDIKIFIEKIEMLNDFSKLDKVEHNYLREIIDLGG